MNDGWRERAAGLGAEVEKAVLGDERLRKRAVRLMTTLAAEPDKSLPAALKTDAALEAAYRFFNNEAVTPEKVLAPHAEATLARMKSHDVVLAVSDTSTMSFSPDGKRRGLGRVRSTGQAFFAHVTLAVAADGTREPLGVLAMSSHVRPPLKARKTKKAKDKKRAPNEKDRWDNQARRVSEMVDGKRVIYVADREADDYRFMAGLLGRGDRFIIRVRHDRVLVPDSEQPAASVEEALREVRVQAVRDVQLSRRPKVGRSPVQLKGHPAREGRPARLAVGATRVTLKRPDTQEKHLPPELRVSVVRVWEPEPPAGEASVEWTLITTEPTETEEQILAVVDGYRARWVIEESFKALKSGCSFEKRQLESLEGLLNVLALYAPIAWALLRFRSEARRVPEAPATRVLSPTQIEVLRAFHHKPLPPMLTSRDALLAVASWGGHLKRNGEPGWQTLRLGYELLIARTEGWIAAKTPARCDQS